MYQLPTAQIPWEISAPPKELVELIEKGLLKPPADILDIACGSGNYSFYLAKFGFNVTGVDISETAIKLALQKASSSNPKFLIGDITNLENIFPDEAFDFVLDYSILHHISDEQITYYADQFEKILNPGGKILLVCYCENDQKIRVGDYGNKIYHRTKEEILEHYKSFKLIDYKQTTLGKHAQHKAHSFLFSV